MHCKHVDFMAHMNTIQMSSLLLHVDITALETLLPLNPPEFFETKFPTVSFKTNLLGYSVTVSLTLIRYIRSHSYKI